MTPSTLLGGTAAGGASSSANSSRATNSAGNGDAGNRDGFASMLERPSPKDGGTSRASAGDQGAGRAREADGKAKDAASRQTKTREDANRKDAASANTSASTSVKSDDTAGKDEAPSMDPSSTGAPAAANTAPQDQAPAATPVDAPWPPPGLAGLALSTSAPASAEAPLPTAPLPAATATTGNATIATITPPSTASTDAMASGTTALPVAAASSAQTQPGAGDEAATVQVDQVLQQAMADTSSDVDGALPSPTLLHALGAAPEIRGTAPSSIFTGDPTPVPNMEGDGFDDAIGARVGWLADQKIGHAHIRISPDDMGQIDVRLHLDGDRLHATFQSNQAEVRQALEQSLPRLREMLGEHGFQLGNADVGQQHQGNGGAHADAGAHGMGGGDATTLGNDAALPAPLIRLNRLLDAYA